MSNQNAPPDPRNTRARKAHKPPSTGIEVARWHRKNGVVLVDDLIFDRDGPALRMTHFAAGCPRGIFVIQRLDELRVTLAAAEAELERRRKLAPAGLEMVHQAIAGAGKGGTPTRSPAFRPTPGSIVCGVSIGEDDSRFLFELTRDGARVVIRRIVRRGVADFVTDSITVELSELAIMVAKAHDMIAAFVPKDGVQ